MPKASKPARSEEHTSELQSHRDLHSFPTRRSSDLVADADAVIDVGGMGGGAALAGLVSQHRDAEGVETGGRLVVAGAPRHFRAAFFQITVADADFLADRARFKQ